MNMLEMIGSNMASRNPINQGFDFFAGLFGSAYPINELCQILDYGYYPEIKGNISDSIREMQYASLLGALAQHYGADFNEWLGNCCELSEIRDFIFSGKADAYIYQGQ